MNQNVPAISVLIPVYNVEEYLEECVESVLKQSYQDFEIILVDDFSTDKSRSICETLKARDSRIRTIYHTKNKGVSASRNTCLRAAIGKYIAFVDSDDLVKPNYLKEMYDIAEKTGADVVATGGREYRQNDKGEWTEGIKIELTKEQIFLTENMTERLSIMSAFKLSPTVWSKLIRRSVIEENEICHFEAIQFEDVLFHFPLLYSAKKYVITPHESYLYRQSADSICRGATVEKTRKAVRSILGCLKSVENYMEIMSDIYADNLQLQYHTRYFFAKYLFESYYLEISKGLPVNDILVATYQALDEDKIENTGLFMYLIHEQLKNIAQKNKEQEKQ